MAKVLEIELGEVKLLGDKPTQEKRTDAYTREEIVLPDRGYMLSKVIVNPVTSDIDTNITSTNIRQGVTILGVEGNLAPDKPNQIKTADPLTTSQIISADTGYELESVMVNAVTNEIDNNITSGNIKKDVTILGVTGVLEYPQGLDPSNFEFDEEKLIGYHGDYTLPEIIIPKSYSLDENNNPIVGEDIQITTIEGIYNNIAGHYISPFTLYTGKIILQPNITTIGNGAFYSCEASEIEISNNVTTIGDYAFYSCINLRGLTIPENVTSIGNYAFKNSLNLFNNILILPQSIRSIGTEAFSQTRRIISYAYNPPELSGLLAENETNYPKSIEVPANAIDMYKNSNNWSIYADKVIPIVVGEQSKSIQLDFTNGTQYVYPDINPYTTIQEGYYLKEVEILKPYRLTPENIKHDVDIAGVIGTYGGDTYQTKTIKPTTSQQVVTADTGYNLDSVIVEAVTHEIDANITPGNIKYGVTILGQTGIYEGDGLQNDMLQTRIDVNNDAGFLFYSYKGTNVDYISGLNTSNVTNMTSMFERSENLITIPYMNTENVLIMNSMCLACSSLKSFPALNTSNVKDTGFMFYNCGDLEIVAGINMINVTSASSMFNNCYNLTNLTLKNIKINLTIGSGISYGQLITQESLINTIKELWDYSSESVSYTLTMSQTNIDKLSNVYVKLITPTQEQINADPYINNKKPCEVCEAIDEGAMLITDYVTLKKWALA